MNTIGASRPLAPWQVSTRTSSRGRSGSRISSVRVGAQPVQERLHRRRVALLEGERLGEERLDRLGRRRTEPGEQAPAAAALAEQADVELERRQEVDLRQQLAQARVRLGEGRPVARRLQTLVQASAPPRS